MRIFLTVILLALLTGCGPDTEQISTLDNSKIGEDLKIVSMEVSDSWETIHVYVRNRSGRVIHVRIEVDVSEGWSYDEAEAIAEKAMYRMLKPMLLAKLEEQK